MHVMIASDERFFKTPAGHIYSNTVLDYGFWQRYLQFFDRVSVLARVTPVSEKPDGKKRADGPGVGFKELPGFTGPWKYLLHYFELSSLVRKAIIDADVFILRIPGMIGSSLGNRLIKQAIPFGVEVLGDPWDALAPGNLNGILTPIARTILTSRQKRQCRNAIAAAYVTESALQRRYPPSGWSTHYSSIDIPISGMPEQNMVARFAAFDEAAEGKRPFRICNVGSMTTLYKGQDILLEAAAILTTRGFNLKVVFLGDGGYRPYYEETARRLAIADRVEFLGNVPFDMVDAQLDRADIFVLPSLAEGLPRALIEAMARGLPAVGSDIGGVCELIEETVPMRDPSALACAIARVLSNRSLAEKISRRNLESVQKYDRDVLNARRIEFYRKLAGEVK